MAGGIRLSGVPSVRERRQKNPTTEGLKKRVVILNRKTEDLEIRPDEIYWRWSYRAPVQFIPLEDVWFYPGDGLCVDGYYWWKTDKMAKRLDRDTWIKWGRKKSPPRQERSTRGFLRAIRLEAFEHG